VAVTLDPASFQWGRRDASGWQFLMPPTAGRRLLCFDCLDGFTMLLLAETARELTVIHDREEKLAELVDMARQAGVSRVSFALLGPQGELPDVAGSFDGVIVQDPLNRVLVARKTALDAVCAAAAARLSPGGFLYLGFRNRYGYSRLRRSRAGADVTRLLSVRGTLQAVRRHGLTMTRPNPLLLEASRVLEMIPESGYRSFQNPFLATERLRRIVLRGLGARYLAPAYGVVAFRGAPSPSWLDRFIAEPWIQELCPGARLRRHLVLNMGKVVLSLASSVKGHAGLIAVIAPDDSAVARRHAEAAVLQDLSHLPEHLAHTVPTLFGERRFEEARVFLLREFEGTTVDRESPLLPELTQLATSWLIAFQEATRVETAISEETWPLLFGGLFQEAVGRNPPLRTELTLLEPEVRRAVMGRALPAVWMHGDYKLENIVFDLEHHRLLGVIDWELSRRRALPLLDLLYLLLYNRVIRAGGDDVADLVALVVEGGWTAAEQAILSEYNAHFAGVAQVGLALLAMFFVHHIGVRCNYDLSREATVEKLRVIIRELRDRLLSKAPDAS
jgi:hypothetical protein